MANQLYSLCEEYVWYLLIARHGGAEFTERHRVRIHKEIADLLGIETCDGALGLFHSLEDLGFPTGLAPDVGSWETIATSVGRKAYDILAEEFDLTKLV